MIRRRRLSFLLALSLLGVPSTYALFNLNQGKDLIFVSGTYTIGYDTNVFTRASAVESTTQTASIALDYSRQAGLIGVTASLTAAWGQFGDVTGQDFSDPSLTISLRKRYGRTTGALSGNIRHESQPDPDVGQRTQSLYASGSLDVRYPVNDRYYLTNVLSSTSREYDGNSVYADLHTVHDYISINYIYTSKLDLNAGYSVGYSDTDTTRSLDQSFTIGATGTILPKLSGTLRMGVQRRDSDSSTAGSETFESFASSTTLKWLLSRRFSINVDLTDDYSTSATDISVNRATAGLHAAFSLSSKYVGNAGLSYTLSEFLGEAGGDRQDEMLQFDASIGVAITTSVRTTVAYDYTINYSTLPDADYERQSLSLSLIATY